MSVQSKSTQGRGAAGNPANRFEPIHLERDADWNPAEDPAPVTQFLRDASASILSCNESPDIGYTFSVNPYRGCEHGCIYCYARPTHEYLGFSCGLDFETRILVKDKAPELLRQALASPRWQPATIAFSGVTDCYQPVERRLRLTRQCLEVMAECRNPVCIVTKNHLVTRDLDLLAELARVQAATVLISLTTLDRTLTPKLEPRTSMPEHRLAAMRALHGAGVPVGVLVSPVIPGITDHEIPRLLHAAAEAGASFAFYTLLRLPHAVKDIFVDWLERHFPERKEKVLGRLRDMRGGRLSDAEFFSRMTGEGLLAEQIRNLFEVSQRRAGLAKAGPALSTAAFRRPAGAQLPLL